MTTTGFYLLGTHTVGVLDDLIHALFRNLEHITGGVDCDFLRHGTQHGEMTAMFCVGMMCTVTGIGVHHWG